MLAAVEAQQRIIEVCRNSILLRLVLHLLISCIKLKRNRDKRTSEVTAKANAALDDIVARVKKRVHEFEQEKYVVVHIGAFAVRI